jgi:hypothetical protein
VEEGKMQGNGSWITHLWTRFQCVARVGSHESLDDFTVVLWSALEKLFANFLIGEHVFEQAGAFVDGFS